MVTLKLKLSKSRINFLQNKIRLAKNSGKLKSSIKFISVLLISRGNSITETASILAISCEQVRQTLKKYICGGLRALAIKTSRKKQGRPPKLTKSQRKELSMCIQRSPTELGFESACWRSPMIQELILTKFGVCYSAKYISELLKTMGFSYQKAKFDADKKDDEKREEWLSIDWPNILKTAKERKAYLLFADECSFPQWGSLSRTWSLKGVQPTVKTCGVRKGYKVFGMIDYFSGKFFSKGIEGKLNGESYIDFLQDILNKTKKHIFLVHDGAPYHKSKKVNEFIAKNKSRINVNRLPSYSPDFNPIELLWKKIKERGTHLKFFKTFGALKDAVNSSLEYFSNACSEVLSLFGIYKPC